MLGQPFQLGTYGELDARATVPAGDLRGTGCWGKRSSWGLTGNWMLGQPFQLGTYGELDDKATVPTGELSRFN